MALKWSFIKGENAAISEVMWELTAVNSHTSPVYLWKFLLQKDLTLLFTAEIFIHLVWEGNSLMQENIHHSASG